MSRRSPQGGEYAHSVLLAGALALGAAACGDHGHGGDEAQAITAIEQELEAYHHAVSAAATVEAARERTGPHHAFVNEQMARMHGMDMMGMGTGDVSHMGTMCTEQACRGMVAEMDAHHQAMGQTADLAGARTEVDRHRDGMRRYLEEQRQHHGATGGMMMGATGGH